MKGCSSVMVFGCSGFLVSSVEFRVLGFGLVSAFDGVLSRDISQRDGCPFGAYAMRICGAPAGTSLGEQGVLRG